MLKCLFCLGRIELYGDHYIWNWNSGSYTDEKTKLSMWEERGD